MKKFFLWNFGTQTYQGCNHREILVTTSAMVSRINPVVKVSENLGSILVLVIAPVDPHLFLFLFNRLLSFSGPQLCVGGFVIHL